MPRQIITTPDAPSSPLYSQGVRTGGNVFVSGMVGIDPSTNSLAGATIQDQTRQALRNCEAVLAAGGATLDDVVEVGVLLTHSSDFAGLNEEYAQMVPCRTANAIRGEARRRHPGRAGLDTDDRHRRVSVVPAPPPWART